MTIRRVKLENIPRAGDYGRGKKSNQQPYAESILLLRNGIDALLLRDGSRFLGLRNG